MVGEIVGPGVFGVGPRVGAVVGPVGDLVPRVGTSVVTEGALVDVVGVAVSLDGASVPLVGFAVEVVGFDVVLVGDTVAGVGLDVSLVGEVVGLSDGDEVVGVVVGERELVMTYTPWMYSTLAVGASADSEQLTFTTSFSPILLIPA